MFQNVAHDKKHRAYNHATVQKIEDPVKRLIFLEELVDEACKHYNEWNEEKHEDAMQNLCMYMHTHCWDPENSGNEDEV